jgi:hypothetical protein
MEPEHHQSLSSSVLLVASGSAMPLLVLVLVLVLVLCCGVSLCQEGSRPLFITATFYTEDYTGK